MFSLRTISVLVVVAICINLSTAGPLGGGSKGPKGRKHKGIKFLGRIACNLDLADGTHVRNRTCGCGNETQVACSVGPVSLSDKDGNTLSATFCPVENDWTSERQWRGVLGAACRITTVADPTKNLVDREDPCGENGTCVTDDSTKSLSFSFNDTAAVAYFCDRQLEQQDRKPGSEGEGDTDGDTEGDGTEPDGQEPDGPEPLRRDRDDDDCIPLSYRRDRNRGDRPRGDRERPRIDRDSQDRDRPERRDGDRPGEARGGRQRGGQGGDRSRGRQGERGQDNRGEEQPQSPPAQRRGGNPPRRQPTRGPRRQPRPPPPRRSDGDQRRRG